MVNAVGNSKFWNNTAIFVMRDEWGGWYDPVAPPYADYDGLGLRVPLLVISPYAKQGYVSHVQYETASVLRLIEDDFGLAQMAAADARANDPAGDCFNFSQQPRAFRSRSGSAGAGIRSGTDRGASRRRVAGCAPAAKASSRIARQDGTFSSSLRSDATLSCGDPRR